MQGPTQRQLETNIPRYYLFHFFLNFQLWFPIWIIYLTKERGLTLAQVTLIDIPFWLSIVLLQMPAAALADRWGRKPTLVAAATAFAVAITFFGLATSYWLILGAYLVWALAFSLLNGTESAFLYDTLKTLGREDEYANLYGRGWAIQTVAAVAGTLIGAPVAAATSLPFPIILSGGLAAFALVAAITFKEPPRVQRSETHLTYGQIIRDSIEIVRRLPAVRYAIMFVSVTAVGSLGPIFFFQPFLVHHNVAVGTVGLWQTPMRAAGFVAALAVMRIVLSLGERRTFYLMPVALIGSYALLASWDSVYAQVAFPVMNIVFIVSQPTLTDYLNRRVPSEQRATVVSLTNLVRSAVLIPTAPLMGRLADEVSLSASFAAGGIIVAVLAVPLLILWLPHLSGRTGIEPGVPESAPVGGS